MLVANPYIRAFLVAGPAALVLVSGTAHAQVPPETKPEPGAEVKPGEAKPPEVKAAETKPAEVKPAEVKPTEAKLGEAKPAEEKPTAPVAAKGVEAKVGPIEIKAYGFLNAQVEYVWAKGGATPFPDRGRVTDGGSRLGFAAAYVFSVNTRAMAQLEAALTGFEQGGVNDLGAPISLTSRNTFVGIEDKRVGRFLVGNYDSAYRSLLGTGGPMGGNMGLSVVGLDAWNNTTAQLSGNPNSIFSRGEARYQNSVHYITPEWAVSSISFSVQAAGSYSFDESLVDGTRRDRASAALLLKVGPVSLGGGMDYQWNTGIDTQDLQAGKGMHTHAENGLRTYYLKGVASVRVPKVDTYLGFGYESSNYDYSLFMAPLPPSYYPTIRTGTVVQNGLMGTLAQPIFDLTVMGSVGALLIPTNTFYGKTQDYQALQYSFGAKYAFSETFGAYAFYTAIQNKPQQNVNLGGAVYSNNLGTSQAYLAPGNSPHAVGAGGIVRF